MSALRTPRRVGRCGSDFPPLAARFGVRVGVAGYVGRVHHFTLALDTRKSSWSLVPCLLDARAGDQSLPPPEIVRAFSHFLENYPTQPSPPPPPPPLPDISPRTSSSRIRLPALSRASAPERPGSSDPNSSSPFTVSLDARTFARADVFSLGLLALALMQVTGSHLENLFPPLTPGAPDLRRGDLQQVPEAPRPWWLFPPPAEGATRRFSGSFVAQVCSPFPAAFLLTPLLHRCAGTLSICTRFSHRAPTRRRPRR